MQFLPDRIANEVRGTHIGVQMQVPFNGEGKGFRYAGGNNQRFWILYFYRHESTPVETPFNVEQFFSLCVENGALYWTVSHLMYNINVVDIVGGKRLLRS